MIADVSDPSLAFTPAPRRGDIIAAPAGYDHTRTRCLLVLSDPDAQSSDRCIVCSLGDATGRWPLAIAIAPDPGNGLAAAAEVWPATIRNIRLAPTCRIVGRITSGQLAQVFAGLDQLLGR